MPRKSLADVNCSWTQAAEAIGDKWLLLILRDAMFGVRTFAAFEKNIGISRSILTQRLQHLQQHGILEKSRTGVGTSRSEYSLMEKGQALLPVLMSLAQWGDDWVFGEDKVPMHCVDRKTKRAVAILRVTSQDGEELSIDSISVTAGPGANPADLKAVAAIQEAHGEFRS